MERRTLYEYILHPIGTLNRVFGNQLNPSLSRQQQKNKNNNFSKNSTNRHLSEYMNRFYSTNRINLYLTYREMMDDPIMERAIDKYAQSATQVNSEGSEGEGGRVVWCYSKDAKIQKIIMNLFDKIELDNIIPLIVRNVCAYGEHFEQIMAVRGKGVERLFAYDPWHVAADFNDEEVLKGYCRSDERGEPIDKGNIVHPYLMLHFMMPRRSRTQKYGVTSSIFYGVREYWQELQWMLDKLVIERMQRRPDRLLITLDIGGIPTLDSYEAIEEFRRNLFREEYSDFSKGELSTMAMAMGEQRDLILPTGTDNKTTIGQAPATSNSTPLDDVYLMTKRLFSSMDIHPGFMAMDSGESYDHSSTIEKQYVAFSQRATCIQRAVLRELVKLCKIHLTYLQTDALREENKFTLYMTPVSAFAEIERKDLLLLRYDLMDRAMELGKNHGWNMEYWGRYVMKEYAKFSDQFIDNLLKKPEAEQIGAPQDNVSSGEDFGDSGFQGGGGSDDDLSVPKDDFSMKMESSRVSDSFLNECEMVEKMDSLPFDRKGIEARIDSYKECSRNAKMERYKNILGQGGIRIEAKR